MNFSSIIPWVLTLATLSVGAWQFSSEQVQSNRRPFLERQMGLGFEIVDSVSIMATTTDVAEWKKARAKFWRLYWGKLALVETRAVELSMAELGKIVPSMQEGVPSLPFRSLQRGAYELSRDVRGMLSESWKVQLIPLSERTVQDNLK